MATLELKNVNKVFGSGANQVVALDDINFKSVSGELTLILGPSGSGKSTLLTILGGIQTASSGQVLLDEHSLNDLSKTAQEKNRLDKIGFILQRYSLVPFLTVKQQFELVDKVKGHNLSPEVFENLLDELGIQKLLAQYPGELSGGQSQRVAIARALYGDPSIVLADEPTTALDSSRVEVVGQLFQDIAHNYNKAIVTVTHDIRLKKFADHIYELVDGHLQQVK